MEPTTYNLTEHTMNSTRLVLGSVLLALPALSGCSRSTTPDPTATNAQTVAPATSSVAAAASRQDAKACNLVTAQEMSAILGASVAAVADDHSNGRTGCIYKSDKPIEHTTPYAELSVDWGSGEGAMAANGMLSRAQPGISDPYAGIGDQAVATGPMLMIRTGEDLVTITLSGVDDMPAAARKIFNTAKSRMR